MEDTDLGNATNSSSPPDSTFSAILTVPLTEFTLLPKLPTELRLKIYEYAVSRQWSLLVKPQSVIDFDLEIIYFKFSLKDCIQDEYDYGVSLFSACSESRKVCMNKLSASLPMDSGHDGGTHKAIIRYDPTYTTICIQDFVTLFMWDKDLHEASSKGFRRQP